MFVTEKNLNIIHEKLHRLEQRLSIVEENNNPAKFAQDVVMHVQGNTFIEEFKVWFIEKLVDRINAVQLKYKK